MLPGEATSLQRMVCDRQNFFIPCSGVLRQSFPRRKHHIFRAFGCGEAPSWCRGGTSVQCRLSSPVQVRVQRSPSLWRRKREKWRAAACTCTRGRERFRRKTLTCVCLMRCCGLASHRLLLDGCPVSLHVGVRACGGRLQVSHSRQWGWCGSVQRSAHAREGLSV